MNDKNIKGLLELGKIAKKNGLRLAFVKDLRKCIILQEQMKAKVCDELLLKIMVMMRASQYKSDGIINFDKMEDKYSILN